MSILSAANFNKGPKGPKIESYFFLKKKSFKKIFLDPYFWCMHCIRAFPISPMEFVQTWDYFVVTCSIYVIQKEGLHKYTKNLLIFGSMDILQLQPLSIFPASECSKLDDALRGTKNTHDSPLHNLLGTTSNDDFGLWRRGWLIPKVFWSSIEMQS